MVSVVVDGLMLGGALGESRDTPVRDAANRAAVLEDEGSGCAGDTGEAVLVSEGARVNGGCNGEDELFDLGEAAGADLGEGVSN